MSEIYLLAVAVLLAILASSFTIFMISIICLLIFGVNYENHQPSTTFEFFLQCNYGHLNDRIPVNLQKFLIAFKSKGHEIYFIGEYVKWLDSLNGTEPPPIYIFDNIYCYKFDSDCSWLPVIMVHKFGHSIKFMPFVNKITLFKKNNGEFIFIPINNLNAIPIPLPLAQFDCEEITRVENILEKKIIVSVIQPCSLEKLCILILNKQKNCCGNRAGNIR